MTSSNALMPGLRDTAGQAPQPKPKELSEKDKRQIDEFFMFYDFDQDPLFDCPHQGEQGRNLVLCIDGTANQFSDQVGSDVLCPSILNAMR